jgi:cysteine desulfurase
VLTLPVYLDNHSTTRVDRRVLDAMWPFFSEKYGNASSTHRLGQDAADSVDVARGRVATLLGASPQEIVFTSGATEANNLALKGVAASLQSRGRHIISSAAEHKAVLDPLKRLAREGWDVTFLPCDETGMVSAASVEAALTQQTVLVSVMAANNEVGTINPFAEIGRLCRDRGILFHTDATQAAGKFPIDVDRDWIDLLSLSAHKIYGPKGVGALYVRRRDPQVKLDPLFDGGGHERGMRSGTLPVPLLVGLGEAVTIAASERESDNERIFGLREELHRGLASGLDGLRLNGHPTRRLPATLNLSFDGVEGESLMMAMRDVAVSSGSACTSSNPEPSHVLMAMGRDEASARASLRFSLGRFTTAEEIEFAIRPTVAVTRRPASLHGHAYSAAGTRGETGTFVNYDVI